MKFGKLSTYPYYKKKKKKKKACSGEKYIAGQPFAKTIICMT